MRRFADLSGKRFIITGASSGIGRSCAELFAELGASLVLIARDASRLEEVRSSLKGFENHEIFSTDLSEHSGIEPLVAKILISGPLDGIVHSAGVCAVAPLPAVSAAAVEKSMAVNLGAFLELLRCCTRKGAANQGFSAVAVSSVSASAGWAGGTVYSASKGALSAAVRSLAVELAPKGYRVNCVSPSHIRTALFERLTAFNGEEAMAELESRQPLGFGLPGQVASAVAFLASGEAGFITGVDLPVDGGYLAK